MTFLQTVDAPIVSTFLPRSTGAKGLEVGPVGPDYGQVNGIEKPIGPSNFVKWYRDEGNAPDGEKIPTDLRNYGSAFGLLSIGCTATHIGNGLVLSAGHCFMEFGGDPLDNATCGDDVTVRFGYLYRKYVRTARTPAAVSDPRESSCTKIVRAEFSDGVDYAIFEVDNPPTVAVPVDATARPKIGTQVTVVGHPSGRPLEWSMYCATASTSVLPWDPRDVPSRFAHQCDTQPVSSGSPVIQMSPLAVIGIHNGGKITDKQGAQDWGWNFGTYLADTGLTKILTNAASSVQPAPPP
ncbi:MAG: trypsin-like peptidase domain-containing protein [Polyangiaceae bacterium]|nr:trypsin-like peptidase domain-containing protein [Polyangiaceae bacterium]